MYLMRVTHKKGDRQLITFKDALKGILGNDKQKTQCINMVVL